MTRLTYVIKETLRDLRHNPWTALASLLSLTLLYLLFDLFWISAGTSQHFYHNLTAQLRVEAFVEEPLPDSLVRELTARVTAVSGVTSVSYVSREEARTRLAEMVGTDLLAGYDEANPLPRSYQITVAAEQLTSDDLARIEVDLMALRGIDAVNYSRDWLLKAESGKRLVWQVGVVLGSLILAAAVIGSANNIRLMTKARAGGFRQMLLLGAGRFFIALPFVIEGFVISGLAAVAGWIVIVYASTRIAFAQFEVVYPATDEKVLFCVGAALLGALSAYVGVHRQLREHVP